MAAQLMARSEGPEMREDRLVPERCDVIQVLHYQVTIARPDVLDPHELDDAKRVAS